MKYSKKSQEAILNWFWVLIFIFFVGFGYLAMTQAFQAVDHSISPRINITTPTQDGQEVVNKIRRYWIVWPIVLIVVVIVLAFLITMKQDPNYPYQ